MLHENPQIKKYIDELWNKFWAGGIANPLTAIEQITYLLFMKRIDKLDEERQRDAEFSEEEFTSVFDGVYPKITLEEKEKIDKGEVDNVKRVDAQTLRWKHFKNISPNEDKLKYIYDFAFPFIKTLEGENSNFTQHMKNAVFVIPSPSLIDEAISTIEKIFEEIEKDKNNEEHKHQDIQGDVYEMLLNEIASAGKNGQFRTPRHIIELVVKLVNPDPDDKIADPACGTGGFLLGAYQHGLNRIDTVDKKSDVTKFLGSNLHGFDIDVTMVRLGLMNLMMHGINNPQIDYMDTLSKKFNHDELGTYDTILANPPFTGNLNKGEIDSSLTISTTKTELLFIDRIYSLLKKGGSAGIIIPQGVLFGTGKAFVDARKLMIENSQLKAVITMPSGVFKPYAGVATAILIFSKIVNHDEEIPYDNDYDVWFYEMHGDGFTLDDKRNPDPDKNDIPNIIEKYQLRDIKKDNSRKAKHFVVSKKEIVENDYDLSFNSYKEETYEEILYEEPSVIMTKLDNLEIDIQNELKTLKSLF